MGGWVGVDWGEEEEASHLTRPWLRLLFNLACYNAGKRSMQQYTEEKCSAVKNLPNTTIYSDAVHAVPARSGSV